QVDPPLGQVLQQRVLLGDAYRVVGGDQGGGGGEDQPAGARRDVRQHGGGRGREERRVVVLADGEYVQAHLLRLARDGDDRVDPLRFARGVPRDRIPGDVAHRKDAELHALSLSRPAGSVRRDTAITCVCMYPTRLGAALFRAWRIASPAAARYRGSMTCGISSSSVIAAPPIPRLRSGVHLPARRPE